MVKKSIYIGFLNFFFKLSQKIDLNMSEYVEFYGDHVFLVQMIPNIAQISIFTNFIKNPFFYIFCIFFKKGVGGKSCGPPVANSRRGSERFAWSLKRPHPGTDP